MQNYNIYELYLERFLLDLDNDLDLRSPVGDLELGGEPDLEP